MAGHDIVVIGASAGGIEVVRDVISELPADLTAAIFVVVHIPPYIVSQLPQILNRAGPLPASRAVDGAPILPGRVYVAPPDRHLLLRPGRMALSRGPRENHSRPAIDPLFRSASRAYGPRVIGVVLSGALYDGAMGLMAIKTRAGMAIVQDPRDAAFDSMPRTALRIVEADYVLPAAEIAPTIVELSRTAVISKGGEAVADRDERLETVIAADFAEQAHDDRVEETTIYTCPECGGVLWQDGAGGTLSFHCHVGHAYAPEILLSQKSEEFEAALWASLRLLKEKATLTRQLANRTRLAGNGGNGRLVDRIAEQAELDEGYARSIQELLDSMPNPADHASIVVQALEEAG
jgi:two-component system chemotaxis response regulator CheB